MSTDFCFDNISNDVLDNFNKGNKTIKEYMNNIKKSIDSSKGATGTTIIVDSLYPLLNR